MKKLCFAIPTWNRAKKLEICVREIAKQIIELGKQDQIGIFVSDNCSEDDTPKVLARLKREYPFLDYQRLNKHVDTANSGEASGRGAQGEYLWLFGDDDILLKDGLRIVWHILETKKPTLIHAGNGWLKPHSYKIYEGTVLEFCNKMGFNQFIGWATSVIVSKEKYLEMVDCPDYEQFKKASFSHVLGLLYVATTDYAVVIDHPICEPMEPQTEEDMKRWDRENIGWRYFLTVDGLKILFQKGILKEKLKPMFFRYLNYYLWDRFITHMIITNVSESPYPEKGWELILAMADMIDDPDMAKRIRTNTISAYQLCATRKSLINQINAIETILKGIVEETNKTIFELGWAGGEK